MNSTRRIGLSPILGFASMLASMGKLTVRTQDVPSVKQASGYTPPWVPADWPVVFLKDRTLPGDRIAMELRANSPSRSERERGITRVA